MMHDYISFFKDATDGHSPYPYQQRLATAPWPELVEIETGLGKTAAIICAWLYKRSQQDTDTPRRLVFCLPMRTLVEQTRENACKFAKRTGSYFKLGTPPKVHVLMGGEKNSPWDIEPDQDMILIGTQDMLLSRALMRGYGMSRYQWPLHFAWLHNDTLWVFDEVQLMGPGIKTSAQLEAFRRKLKTMLPSRSLWMSATLDRRCLETVDFKSDAEKLEVLTLGTQDLDLDAIKLRYKAKKRVRKAEVPNPEQDDYASEMAKAIIHEHQPGETTLVIVNSVARAQKIFKVLKKASDNEKTSTLLLHGRFRGEERAAKIRQLKNTTGEDRIVIATQIVEAGVDMTSAVLFTELAPWSSMVQRFGRCNRNGESKKAMIFWIDIPMADNAAPYEPEALERSRSVLLDMENASPSSLPIAPKEQLPIDLVLRRRDLFDLFDTDPDLLGFDVDISSYIRDSNDADLHVFWRKFKEQPGENQSRPIRKELCRVSVGNFIEVAGKKKKAFHWDSLLRRWVQLNSALVYPGLTLMLSSSEGGYDPEVGFDYTIKGEVLPVVDMESDNTAATEVGYDDDPDSLEKKRYIELVDHLEHVHVEAEKLAASLNLDGIVGHAVIRAAAWHDLGKSHEIFQECMRREFTEEDDPRRSKLWAKSEHKHRMKKPFRHELASALAFLSASSSNNYDKDDHDLIAYLIAAHHGKVRMSIRSLPNEEKPDEARQARGVKDGDELTQEITLPTGEFFQGTTLSLDLMELGEGKQGPSWAMRTQALLKKYGPFQLAFLEACVIAADRRASRDEQKEDGNA